MFNKIKQMSQKVKISDYVIDFIANLGVKHIFLISGGGNIHLIDSIGKSKKIDYVCNHHEQASATAAEAYARINGFGACIVTTGPGGTNAITGILGAWLDSIPMICISGQVRSDTLAISTKLRQLGDQEADIISIVKSITKYSVCVLDAQKIKYYLEKSVYLAKNGRPGPVWLDIPVDIQGTFVDTKNLKGFKIKKEVIISLDNKKTTSRNLTKVLQKLRNSRRPVLYAGNGIRLAGAQKEFLNLIRILKIPVLTSYAGYDLVPSNNPYFFGRAHAFGQRAANFIIQNSDLLLTIGARLDIRTIGFTHKAFARGAYKIMVDIDKSELEKPIIKIDLPIHQDAKEFILKLQNLVKKDPLNLKISEWLAYGKRLNKKYQPVLNEFWKEKKYVNPYCFIETIGKYLKPGQIIVLSDGIGPLNCSYQALSVKTKQRIILNNGCAQMGYGLPAAIGVCFASSKKEIICFEGDGSIQLNIHELQVIKHHNLPIKIFVYSNDGYLSIRNTQKNLFAGRFTASNKSSGLSCPDITKVATAYGIPSLKIFNHLDMEEKIKNVLKTKGPIICDINSVRDLMLTPKLITLKTVDGKFVSPPLEEMSPLLPRDEFKQNMLIPLWQE